MMSNIEWGVVKQYLNELNDKYMTKCCLSQLMFYDIWYDFDLKKHIYSEQHFL